MHSSAQDGPLNTQNQTGEINYFPSEFSNEARGRACLLCIVTSHRDSVRSLITHWTMEWRA